MKLPDLKDLENAGVIEYRGQADVVEQAATAARLRFLAVDLARVDSKRTLLAAFADGLKLPEHFGDNWDALADCLEDGDWLGKSGVAIRIAHSAAYRKAHPHDWEIAEEILAEAAEFWRERHLPFWVLVA
ncbi:MAG: barstar family protein [Betaproteobacteria bacterium]|nr:barstar family protein [Betaproteobacteria bacterium]MBK9704993.1 barstar family protein [Betaproteobacteria bacterium]